MQDETLDPIYEREAELAADYAEHEIAVAKSRTGVIHYGFGAEYLPKWGMRECLREIYQNFIDYGDYDEEAVEDGGLMLVQLTNGWTPNSLEYLRIGNTQKENANAIGHHGEGLKMAFLILLREGLTSSIMTNKYSVIPEWYRDNEIGDCFSFAYEVHDFYESPYTVSFTCPVEVYRNFHENLVKPDDIIFSHWDYGDLIDKPQGNIYSGGLFVCHLEGISRSYNIKPIHLPLDRDRSVPKAFDVNYKTGKILEASQVMTVKDLAYDDTMYVDNIPEPMLKTVKPRRVGNSIEFTVKDDSGQDTVIKSQYIKTTLQSHSLFQKAIMGIKKFLSKQLGLYDMLLEFKTKHPMYGEAAQDFELILEKVNK